LLLAFFAPELVYFVGPIVPIALLAALQVQLSIAGEREWEQQGVADRDSYNVESSAGRITLAG
jgi:hypothetical protein